eukprot:jgi/Mesen1/2339/ME000155S01419
MPGGEPVLSAAGENESPIVASFLPERNADYLKSSYWDKRFEQEEEYEWFKGYSAFRDLLLEHCKPLDRILVVGCGNSRLSEELYRDGMRNIVSTDLSEVVIERMREGATSRGCAGITWQVADMLNLPHAEGSFDVVIEKGAMDVLYVDSESAWTPSQEVRARVHAMLASAHRVLAPAGLFISITFGQPHFRRPLLEDPEFTWAMKYQTFGEGFHYFFYTLRKGSRQQEDSSRGGEAAAAAEQAGEEGPREGWPRESMEHDHMDHDNYLLHLAVDDED